MTLFLQPPHSHPTNEKEEKNNKTLGAQKSRIPKLIDRLKCGSEVKATEEQGVGACSLAHSTLG
jgi:hypothetical protein